MHRNRTLFPAEKRRIGRLRCRPGEVILLHGPRPIFHVAHGAAAEHLIARRRVAVVDGANRFSPHTIALMARQRGIDPETLLGRIAVSRAFTCYQMEAAVTERAPAFVEKHGCSLLLVFGPLDLFYDEQASMRDVHRGVGHMIETLDAFRKLNVAVLVASQYAAAPPGRGHLFASLRTNADSVCRLDIGEAHFALLLEKGNRTPGTILPAHRNR
jgi:hypothetical protein